MSDDRGMARVDEIVRLLERMEELQSRKVLELARRLIPHLTAEDIRNPHDFPDLADPDWHFEDGQLAAIQGVLTNVRSLRSGWRDEDAGGGGP
jgi:hypothetical protein